MPAGIYRLTNIAIEFWAFFSLS